MNHIHVTCAIIEENGTVLAAQRSATMSMPLKWEFPGGKIHDGESPQECLSRELREELGVIIRVGTPLNQSTHDYPQFRITLYPFVCSLESGNMVLHEHADIAWMSPESLSALDWAEADIPVLESYLSLRAENFS